MRRNAIIRIRVITGAIIVLVVVLVGRLYQLQIMRGAQYREEAESQYVYTVEDLFNRGSIYFTTKDNEKVSAATIQAGYLLAINPKKIASPEDAYTTLSSIIPLDQESFLKYAKETNRLYIEIKPNLTEEEANKIDALHVTGVLLYRNQWRYYPGDELAARTIGFVGYDSSTLVGKYGLERYYDDILRRNNEHLSVNFFAEIFSNLGSLVFDTHAGKEGSIATSIEPTVARTLDHELELVQEKWHSRVSGGIIINPRTGEIFAMSVVPSFNLNDRSGIDISAFRNPLVENVYEMGSIIKPLTMASGIDAGAVTPSSTYYDAGRIEVDGFTIGNYDGVGRGTVSMQEVLNQSLNTGVAHVVSIMGKDAFRKYFYNLKLGTETGIDLPNETYGLVKNLESPRDVEYATASFGQGIALTPIATARALSTLANKGVLVTPHIVDQIEYEDGSAHEVGFPPGERVFSEETADTITRMLVKVVDEALAGGTVALPEYSVAAKTGTAQIANETEGGYYDDRYLHSFFGYFPAYDPEFLVFLYTVEPKDVRYASQTLTDPFMNLVRFLINYYNIPPDR